MTASEYCKYRGLDSLVELSSISGFNKRTLERMWHDNNKRFECVLNGALIEKYDIKIKALVYGCRD